MSAQKRLLLFRGEDDLAFLHEWIKEKPEIKIDLDIEEVSSDPKSLHRIIKDCKRCNDIYDKKIGTGTCENGIMIVLNMPNTISRIEKNRLKSKSITILYNMIKSINVNLECCYTTKLIKCESKDSQNRPSLMFKNCAQLLKNEIHILKPKIIIVMGDSMPLRDFINEKRDIFWYEINHPISLIKDKQLKRSAWNTLKEIRSQLDKLNK